MLYNFTIHEVLSNKLNAIKVDVYETTLYQKTVLLLDIWATQKKLGYLFDKFEEIERKEKGLPEQPQYETSSASSSTKSTSYKDQYVEFLMKHDLIFLEEVEDKVALLNLIYYWLLRDVKHDKKLLDNY